jgi:hypothetical protein
MVLQSEPEILPRVDAGFNLFEDPSSVFDPIISPAERLARFSGDGSAFYSYDCISFSFSAARGRQ